MIENEFDLMHLNISLKSPIVLSSSKWKNKSSTNFFTVNLFELQQQVCMEGFIRHPFMLQNDNYILLNDNCSLLYANTMLIYYNW